MYTKGAAVVVARSDITYEKYKDMMDRYILGAAPNMKKELCIVFLKLNAQRTERLLSCPACSPIYRYIYLDIV